MSTCEKKKVRYNAVATYVLDSDGKLSEEQINQIRWRMLDALDHVNDFIPVLQSFECDSAEIIESPDQPKEILPLINAGNLTGDLSGIWGSATGLSGVATGLRGDVSGISGVRRGINGIRGDVSGISGDVTYITGDVSGIHGILYNKSGNVFWGNVSDRLRGDVSGIHGDVSGIHGEVSGIWGDMTDIEGDMTDIEGDVEELVCLGKLKRRVKPEP